jgi:hypothetical protein
MRAKNLMLADMSGSIGTKKWPWRYPAVAPPAIDDGNPETACAGKNPGQTP